MRRAGEAIDIVKKHLAQGHELDREGLIKELGDVAWYLAETATALGVDLDEILGRNIEKLKNRYPEGFSTENRSTARPGMCENGAANGACAFQRPPRFHGPGSALPRKRQGLC